MEEQRVQRRLAAILAADVVGYSRLTGADEEGTLARLRALRRELIDPTIAAHGGRIVKTTGDGILVEFASVVDSVRCAFEVQRGMASHNINVAVDKRIELRVGVHLGDVVVEDDDLLGDGVNVAARLEGIADPGGVFLSGDAYRQVQGKIEIEVEDLGERPLKNIAQPLRVYRVLPLRRSARPSERELPIPDKPSIAVLPFANMSTDAEQEHFADGMTEDIITALSRLHWFFVIARNSTFTYKGKAVDVKQVSRELGVRYVVEGSVRKSGDRLRVTAQLIDASSGNHVWAERYDRTANDLFAVQDEITESIITAIEPHLYVAESTRAQRAAPRDLSAWELVMRAMPHIWRHTAGDFREALQLLQRARELDPSYGQAHSLWAWVAVWNAGQGWGEPMSVIRPLAMSAAEAALALDQNDPWAYFGLGTVHFVSRNTGEAQFMFRRTLELNPNFALAHAFLGGALAYNGENEEAVPEIEKAIRLSPRDPFSAVFHVAYAINEFVAGRYMSSADWARRAVRTYPGYPAAYRFLAASCGLAGLSEEARKAFNAARQLQPGLSAEWVEASSLFVRAEDRARFIEGLRQAGMP
jgi:TolB-like protein/class 3 adenylate cyclase/Flp pilus assembly protein TadD